MVFTNEDQTTGGHSSGEAQISSEKTKTIDLLNVPRAPQPIFAVIAAPLVASTSREALLEWLKLRKDYEEATKERCKDGKEDFNSVLKSVRSSFDSDLLTTLCEASWGVEKSELTDKFLLEKIHEITDNYQNQALPPVNELFLNELTMNMSNPDIQSRVTDYFLSCNRLIKKYGFASFFEGAKGAKKKCKLLVNSLPEALKEKIRNEIDYRTPEAQSNVLKLSKLINQQALEQAIEDRALKRGKDSTRKSTAREQQRSFQSHKKRPNDWKQPQQQEKRMKKADTRKVEKQSEKKEQSGTKGIPKDGCFNCGCPHYLSACPTAAKENRDRHTSERVSDLLRGGTANLRRLAECLPVQARSLVLEDTFSVAFCADSGTDRSGMSMTIFEEFVKVCPEVEIAQLKEPLRCTGADGKPIEVTKIVNLHLRLRTTAGSVRIA